VGEDPPATFNTDNNTWSYRVGTAISRFHFQIA
jgi:hypothetical protein